ncbi:MAG: hypothetical protein AAF585_14155, partial [Verrucomicrobiota bacterium]
PRTRDPQSMLGIQLVTRFGDAHVHTSIDRNPHIRMHTVGNLVRRSVQTDTYQRASLEAATRYLTELGKRTWNQEMLELEQLPEDDPLQERSRLLNRAIEALREWEIKRKELEANSK